jgi:putative ABC transport system ATP-binding protein
MSPALMTARDLDKVYGTGENAFHALSGVSLEVREGESLAIVGQSGSGKSTLLHLLGLLDTADGGELLVHGDPVSGMGVREADRLRNRSFGFVFQQFHLDETATVLENVALPLMISGVTVAERRPRALEVLDRLGLAGRSGERAGNLSGGQRQRVAIARALVNRPRILFADEPTGALDVENSTSVADLLFELNREDGIALVIVTHSPELARRCDRSLRIVDGRIADAREQASGGAR